MPVGAIVGGVAAAGIGAIGANKAAKKQADAAKSATKSQEKMHKQAREDLQPFSLTGRGALYSLADMYGVARPGSTGGEAFTESQLEAFRRSPDYQVALKEGIRAADMSAAARGNLLSGGQLKRVQELGSDIASRHFGSYMDRLMALAGNGQNAAAGQSSQAMQHGSNLANLSLAKGEAQAAGIAGITNSLTGGITSGLSNLMTYQYINKPKGPTNIVPSGY